MSSWTVVALSFVYLFAVLFTRALTGHADPCMSYLLSVCLRVEGFLFGFYFG